MATDVNDLGDMIGSTLGRLAREATHTVSHNGHGSSRGPGNGALSGTRGVVAGLALAAAAPIAAKGAGKVAKSAVLKRTGGSLGGAKDSAKGVAQLGKQLIPGAGGGGGDAPKGKKGTPGVGKGRRMPVQQAVDIAVPVEVAYNQWTQFEEWTQFMHRLDQITQEDDCTVSFRTKIWGMSKEFVAQIVEQRPDERIQWTVNDGVRHTGVVTFHELAPRLTRVQVSLDVEPGSLIEKAARGMRHVKRAVRADLARFKAFIEMQEVETGAWRGVIHDGEVVEEHPSSYDRGRDYADYDDIHDTEHSHAPREGSNGSSGTRGSSRGSSSTSKGKGSGKSSGRHSGRARSGSSSKPKSASARKRGGSRSS